MDQPDDRALDLYKPRIQGDGGQRGDSVVGNSEPMNVDHCQTIGDIDDSQLVGVPVTLAVSNGVLATKGSGDSSGVVKMEVELKEEVVEKPLVIRRRGRPPRGQGKTPPPPPRQKKDEEDVCFICFDGGSLVLCDRRGCPKAYHPSCIKRDDAFFRSKAKWNCGWHICSSCRKGSYYMCYTCPFSLCKGCTKDADYQCIRGNKGLCGTCMKTIMLLEKSLPDGELVQVDFDDKSSWEYLFKVYWVCLKEKLSLTVDELIRAKNPWKGSTVMAHKVDFLGELHDGCFDKRYSSNDTQPQRKDPNRQQSSLNEFSPMVERSSVHQDKQSPESIKWATNELLDFVAHMRNGDTTLVSPFDVQALLLEYVKRNNLRDPQQQCQIVCDLRLNKLFGKSRIGHFEMLNLLESHIHIKETSSANNATSAGADIVINPAEGNGKYDCESIDDCERKRKTRKKADDSRQPLNPDEYAAIDVQNIDLIYLRRDLIVSLIDDNDKFHDMVIGSVVRIQIPNNDQKHDFHRLVQVVGTSKSPTPYMIGEKSTDIMLDILNLDKRETVSIVGLSNQDFTEEECKRLRRSIKCGLVKRFGVGEILNKGMALRVLKVNDCLETEILRLNHLHNQASEKGNDEELQEYVERLQLLGSSEERQRRLHEIPEVHSDPTMDPNYESEEDNSESNNKRLGSLKRTRNWDSDEKGKESVPPQNGANSNVTENDIQNSTITSEQSRDICTSAYRNKEGACLPNDRTGETSCPEKEGFGPKDWNVPSTRVCAATPVTCDRDNQEVLPKASSPLVSTGIEKSSNDAEMERIWLYQDPAGKVQGPFSMMHLRKWSSNGHFSAELRVWRVTESRLDSVLLTDALKGCFNKVPSLWDGSQLRSQGQGNGLSLGGFDNHRNGPIHGGSNSVRFGMEFFRSGNSQQKDHIALCDAENEPMISTGSSSPSKDLCAPADAVNSNRSRTDNLEVGGDSLKNNTWSHQSFMNLLSSTTLSLMPLESSHQVMEGHQAKKSNSPSNEDQNSQNISSGEAQSQPGRKKQSRNEDCSSQSSGQNWMTTPANAVSLDLNSNCNGLSLMSSIESFNFPDLPSTTTKPIRGDVDIKQSASSSILVQESGPSWSSASSLVGGGQFLDLAGEWGRYSCAPGRAVEELDSSLMTCSLKSSEVINDHTTAPTIINWQAIVDEPNDFNSLVDESVSDLLAEVEAMECLSGLASSASMANCGDGLTRDSRTDCFFSVEGFCPTPEAGKVGALSSSAGDLQFRCQPTVKDEQTLTL